MPKRLTVRERAMYAAFVAAFPRCAACWWRGGWFEEHIRHLEVAHIVGGPGRKAERWAIIRLCKLCHMLAHGERIKLDGVYLPKLTMANLLWLKAEADPEGCDMAALAASYFKRRLPEPEQPDRWFLDQRSRNGQRK